MKIRQKSLVGFGVEILWIICFAGIFAQPSLTIKGIVVWMMCLLGLCSTTKIITMYVK